MSSTLRTVLVGTYTEPDFPVAEKGQGIYHLTFDPSTGALTSSGLTKGPVNPSYLVAEPTGRYLYAVNEIQVPGVDPIGEVSAFRREKDGSLTLLNTVSSEGAAPCHLSLDPTGTHLVVANYTGGSVVHYPLGADGRLGPAATVDRWEGRGPTDRQKSPHAHMVLFSKDGRFVYSADLGADRVVLNRWDPKGRLNPSHQTFATAAGAGPRHLAHHPRLDVLYVVSELNGTVEVHTVERASGSLARVQEISTLAPGVTGFAGCGAIRVSADGKFVYVSNRAAFPSITVYAADPATGALTFVENVPTGGRGPRDFTLDPSQQFVLVANQETCRVNVLRRDPITGRLTDTGHSAPVPTPTAVLFVD